MYNLKPSANTNLNPTHKVGKAYFPISIAEFSLNIMRKNVTSDEKRASDRLIRQILYSAISKKIKIDLGHERGKREYTLALFPARSVRIGCHHKEGAYLALRG